MSLNYILYYEFFNKKYDHCFGNRESTCVFWFFCCFFWGKGKIEFIWTKFFVFDTFGQKIGMRCELKKKKLSRISALIFLHQIISEECLRQEFTFKINFSTFFWKNELLSSFCVFTSERVLGENWSLGVWRIWKLLESHIRIFKWNFKRLLGNSWNLILVDIWGL